MNKSEDLNSYELLKDLANIENQFQDYSESFKYVQQMIQIKPKLDRQDRFLFYQVCRSLIDPIRNNLRVYNDYIGQSDIQKESSLYTELANYRQKETEELFNFCKIGCNVIESSLIPNAENSQALAFYNKLSADLNRYSAEFAEGEDRQKYLEKANALYKSAYDIAINNLGTTDPVFLGTVLNYSVLLKDYLKQESEAIELLNNAIRNAHQNYKELSEASKDESFTIIKLMQINLKNWNGFDYTDDEEEEEGQ